MLPFSRWASSVGGVWLIFSSFWPGTGTTWSFYDVVRSDNHPAGIRRRA